jgi:hypothetical protein
MEITTNNEFKAELFCGNVGFCHTRKRTLISQGEAFITQCTSLFYQLIGVGGAAKEAEIAEAEKLGPGHETILLYMNTVFQRGGCSGVSTLF